MTRWAVLLLPWLGILAVDPTAFDYHAVKYLALATGATLCLAAGLLRRRFVWTDLSLALWLFVAVRAWMLLRSPMPGRSVRWWGLLTTLVLVHHLGISRRWLRARAPGLLALLLAACGLYAFVQDRMGATQAHALFANRNFAGAGLAMLLPFGLRRPWAWTLGLLGLAATQSRGGLLAAAAGVALWFAWTRPRLRLWLLGGVPALVLAGGLLLGEANTVKARLAWYGVAAELGWAHPWAGVGAGGFEREYPPLRPIEENRISGGQKVHAVHNDYLESLAEGGLPGLGAHLLLLLALVRAARRHREAACSLLAFGVASLVDLPLRDPSLLALAFFGMAMLGRRRRLPGWSAALALVVAVALLPEAFQHWRADHLLGNFLQHGNEADLDLALEWEPDHPEALMERGREKDLRRLLAKQPHDAGARYNLTRTLFDQEAIEKLQEILLHHDPYHTLTHVRLAVLLMKSDPVAAASVLDDAIDADPRPYRPYALLAHIHREAGRLEQAEGFLREAEARSGAIGVRRERLLLSIAKKSDQAIVAAALALPRGEIRQRAARALTLADRIRVTHPRPHVDRVEGEKDADFAARVLNEQERWLARIQPLTAPHDRIALALANALVAEEPAAQNFHLLARVERSLRHRRNAERADGFAFFLECLEALGEQDPERAADRYKRALRIYPGLIEDQTVPPAIRLFMRAHPDVRADAKRLFAGHPPFVRAVGESR